MSGKEFVKRLKKQGWIVARITGSHYIMQKGNKVVPVPVHGNKDLPKGTLHSIKKQAGWK